MGNAAHKKYKQHREKKNSHRSIWVINYIALESQDRVLGGAAKKNGGSGSIYRDNGGNVKEKKKKKMGNATQKKYKQQRKKNTTRSIWDMNLVSLESQDRVLESGAKKNGGSGSIYRDNRENVKEKKKKKVNGQRHAQKKKNSSGKKIQPDRSEL
jgi:hypothetical protein